MKSGITDKLNTMALDFCDNLPEFQGGTKLETQPEQKEIKVKKSLVQTVKTVKVAYEKYHRQQTIEGIWMDAKKETDLNSGPGNTELHGE